MVENGSNEAALLQSPPPKNSEHLQSVSGSRETEGEVNELYQMLEYWKSEAKANEAALAKSQQQLLKQSRLDKMVSSLKAIQRRYLLKYFMTLDACPAVEKRPRKRSIKINGMERRSIQPQGTRSGSMSVEKEQVRNSVADAQQLNTKILDESMANVEVSLQKNVKTSSKDIKKDFDTDNLSPSPIKPSHQGKILNKENQMF